MGGDNNRLDNSFVFSAGRSLASVYRKYRGQCVYRYRQTNWNRDFEFVSFEMGLAWLVSDVESGKRLYLPRFFTVQSARYILSNAVATPKSIGPSCSRDIVFIARTFFFPKFFKKRQ